MIKFYGLISIMLFVVSSFCHANTEPSCEPLLLTPNQQLQIVRREVNLIAAKSNTFRRLFIKIQKGAIESRALERCESIGRCTETDIAEASREAIESINRRSRKVRAYAFFIGTMVGTAALTTHITASLPPNAKFLSQLVAQISTLGIYVLGAPLLERISSPLRRWAFSMSENGTERHAQQFEHDPLDHQYVMTQSTYSQNAQMGRNVLNGTLSLVRYGLQHAFWLLQPDSTKEASIARAYAAEQIVELAIRMRKLAADVPLESEHLQVVVKTAFPVRFISEPHLLREQVRKRIEELDLEAQQDMRVQYYYDRFLRLTFGEDK
jgi:hypothetical protein